MNTLRARRKTFLAGYNLQLSLFPKAEEERVRDRYTCPDMPLNLHLLTERQAFIRGAQTARTFHRNVT